MFSLKVVMRHLKTVKIHIGKHKTGTTAFQKCLRDNRHVLRAHQIHALPIEIANRMSAVAIRDNLPIPPLQSRDGLMENFSVDEIAQEISDHLAEQKGSVLTISSEHLSYFRTDAEIGRLKEFLPRDIEFEIFVVLRDKASFLNSYKKQVIKSGHGTSADKSSPYYCEPDSWLVNDSAIVELWQRHFKTVTVLDYDPNMIVSDLITAMDLPPALIGTETNINVTPSDMSIYLLVFRRFITLSKLRAKWRKYRRDRKSR